MKFFSRFDDTQHVRPRRSSVKLPAWATYALLGLFVIVVVGLAFLTFNSVKRLVARAPLGVGDFSATDGVPPETATAQAAETQTLAEAEWNEGRVTILLMGIDERHSEDGPWRTDTMILLTLDPQSQTAGMLSLPRDLWVMIPDYDTFDRINNAHFRGDRDDYPGGGGPQLAMKTVQRLLSIPVDYYATVNFRAFVTIIDHLGCIPIDVPQTIDDPDYPAPSGAGYDPFYIEAGQYCMGGETLLKYARTRATFGGDFDRAQRQQQVLQAIRQHVLNTGQLPRLITKAPDIYSAVEDNVKTNLTEGQIIGLARSAASIPEENICSAVISGEYIERLETLPDGSEVVIPDRDAVNQLVNNMFAGTGQCDQDTQGLDLASAAKEENATISLLNGTTREGLATQTADSLRTLGLNIVSIDNADRFDYTATVINNYGGKDATARYIAAVLNVPETAIVAQDDPLNTVDIQVTIGADYQP